MTKKISMETARGVADKVNVAATSVSNDDRILRVLLKHLKKLKEDKAFILTEIVDRVGKISAMEVSIVDTRKAAKRGLIGQIGQIFGVGGGVPVVELSAEVMALQMAKQELEQRKHMLYTIEMMIKLLQSIIDESNLST